MDLYLVYVCVFVQGFGVGYGAKVTISLSIAVIFRKLFQNPREILAQILGEDSLRFGAFVALFNALYKATLCTMRHVRKREDGWNSAVAGFVAGLALLVDSKSRNVDIGLYFMARALTAVCSHLFNGSRIDIALHTPRPDAPLAVRAAQSAVAWIVDNSATWLFSALAGAIILWFIYEPWSMPASYYKTFNRMEKKSGDADVCYAYRSHLRHAANMTDRLAIELGKQKPTAAVSEPEEQHKQADANTEVDDVDADIVMGSETVEER